MSDVAVAPPPRGRLRDSTSSSGSRRGSSGRSSSSPRSSSPGSTSGAGSSSSGTPLTEISIGYVILGCFFQGLQTSLTALGWYGILRYAYPGGVTYMPVLAAYATGVALNNFVPANMGTFVMLLMYVAIVQGATFPGVLGGYVVQKIFYLVIGTLIYLYLFSAVAGSFDFQFGDERDAVSNHPVLVLGIAAGAIFLIAILLRIFWAWVKKMWAKAKEGARDPRRPRRVREVGARCRRWAATPRRSW